MKDRKVPYWGDPKLSDHKRVGKRLIAPWNQGDMGVKGRMSSWELHRLPEVVWIGEIIHFLGAERSVEVVAALMSATYEHEKGSEKTCPPFASSWENAGTNTIIGVRAKLDSQGVLDSLESSLRLFSTLYPRYPLFKLLYPTQYEHVSELQFTEYSQRLNELLDRFSNWALQVHAIVILGQFKAGKLFVAEGLFIPNFDLVFNFKPEHEENEDYNKSAGFLRASLNSFLGMAFGDGIKSASSYFWERGLELSKCQPISEHKE